MRTNADITLFNQYVDPLTKTECWSRTPIRQVQWESRKAASKLAGGGEIANDEAFIFIPFQRGADYLQPLAWQALLNKAGKWTLQKGDVIVLGLVEDEATPTELKKRYDDVVSINQVDTMNFGSMHLRHWQVGAK